MGTRAEIDAAMAALIAADPDLARKAAILVSIPGLGPVTAAAILAEMPEIGTLDRGQVGSLSGTAPITREFGRWKGQARIRGGGACLRRAVYMPALFAVRCNPDLKATYDRLRAKGKPFKLALTLTAVMRKLFILANALIRDDRTWAAENPAWPRPHHGNSIGFHASMKSWKGLSAAAVPPGRVRGARACGR